MIAPAIAAVASEPGGDPIFALIEAHAAAEAEYDECLEVLGEIRDCPPRVFLPGGKVAWSRKQIDGWFDHRLQHPGRYNASVAELDALRAEYHAAFDADIADFEGQKAAREETERRLADLGRTRENTLAQLVDARPTTMAGAAAFALYAIEFALPWVDKQDQPMLSAVNGWASQVWRDLTGAGTSA